jgi:uncharacterized glyoxalase superfamily protein PhnB
MGRAGYLETMRNRSVPVDTVIPHVFYKNLAEAIEWLKKTFGFEEHFRYGEPVAGAQMHLGEAWIMVGSARPGRTSPAEAGCATQMLTIFHEDVDGHFARTRAAGAKIVEDLHETEYGERQYGAEDLEGHLWLFSRHARDVAPEEWGAKVTNPLADWRAKD